MGNGEWGMGNGEWGDGGTRGQGEGGDGEKQILTRYSLLTTPNSQLPTMPHAQFPIPNSLCPMPYAQFLLNY